MAEELKSFGWGLIGPGRFAEEFVGELRGVHRARLVAVASRSKDKAEGFADTFGFDRAYGDYDSLFQDEEIDIVYVVVPHVFHRDLAARALRNGKAVVCEKPLTHSAGDTESLISLAREKGVFLMEAMKTGFLPVIKQARDWIEQGRIGTPLLARADFCFQGPKDPSDRLMNPALAGGAVLDVGIYTIHLTRFLLGEVASIQATGSLAETGVEQSAAILAHHKSGASSVMTCSFVTEEAMDAVIQGASGEIRIPKFHAGTRAELWCKGALVDVCEDDSGGMVKAEIEAAMDAVSSGRTECPGHTHHDTQQLANLMEEVRRQLGSRGPGDSQTT